MGRRNRKLWDSVGDEGAWTHDKFKELQSQPAPEVGGEGCLGCCATDYGATHELYYTILLLRAMLDSLSTALPRYSLSQVVEGRVVDVVPEVGEGEG
jgi:hypothetical protein